MFNLTQDDMQNVAFFQKFKDMSATNDMYRQVMFQDNHLFYTDGPTLAFTKFSQDGEGRILSNYELSDLKPPNCRQFIEDVGKIVTINAGIEMFEIAKHTTARLHENYRISLQDSRVLLERKTVEDKDTTYYKVALMRKYFKHFKVSELTKVTLADMGALRFYFKNNIKVIITNTRFG